MVNISVKINLLTSANSDTFSILFSLISFIVLENLTSTSTPSFNAVSAIFLSSACISFKAPGVASVIAVPASILTKALSLPLTLKKSCTSSNEGFLLG